MKPGAATTLAVLLPVFTIGALAFLTVRQMSALDSLRQQRTRLERDVANVEDSIRRLNDAPPPPWFPTEQLSPREQVSFLNTLRAYADANRVKLVRWTNATPVAPTTNEATTGATPPMPAGIVSIGSAVEVSGAYPRIREFLYALVRSPRLFSLADVRWSRSDRWPATSVTFTLTRYVTAPPGASPFTGARATPGEPITTTYLKPPGTLGTAP